ncbi:hypothetical protein DDW05_01575 [Candidatus Nanobsidianus stetteri]|uniref:Uncharacterized protein n=1 Tax=Nanobsidianus stetteri TaxID=1294122 RepID=A0A2T9WTT7_NANST|nr:hypothetical protein DDW05_01575 [Candidatus Nanobsidianus stetteri]
MFQTIISKINITNRFPFKKNKVYLIYYEHPLAYDNAYIDTADKLLLTWINHPKIISKNHTQLYLPQPILKP